MSDHIARGCTIQNGIPSPDNPVKIESYTEWISDKCTKMNVDVFTSQHKHIQYCEAVIYEDGEIEYANPSHVIKLREIYCKKFNTTPEKLYNKMPVDAIPIKWLVNETKCICIWYDYVCMGNLVPTPMQKDTIQRLQSAGVINVDVFPYPV